MARSAAAVLAVALVGCSLLGAAPGAVASQPLSQSLRHQILRTADLPAPNGRTLRAPRCIAGRLSNVNRRWAMAYLSNTEQCVGWYGGASGEAFLLRRPRSSARSWSTVGLISESCTHGEGGAPDAVLRDLGCGMFLRPWKAPRSRAFSYERCPDVVIRNDDGAVYTRTRGLFAKRVSCHVARVVAHRFLVNDGASPVHPRGFECIGGSDGVACRRGAQRVSWGYYFD